jgi:octaprenyl-diphosphate synthase
MTQLVSADLNHVNSVILGAHAERGGVDPGACGHLIAGGGKRMRPMLTPGLRALCSIMAARAPQARRRGEFIHTADPASMTTVVDGSGLAGASAPPTSSGAIRRACWSAISCSRRSLRADGGGWKPRRCFASSRAPPRSSRKARSISSRASAASKPRRPLSPDSSAPRRPPLRRRLPDRRRGAERDEAVEEALDAYGRNLGIAFQLIDDAIDYSSDPETMGKGVGDDFRDGKVTLPVILAFARGDEADRTFWRQAMEGSRTSGEDLAHATRLLRSSRAIDDTVARARHYGQRAIDALGPFPGGKSKAALVEAVEFAISRAY